MLYTRFSDGVGADGHNNLGIIFILKAHSFTGIDGKMPPLSLEQYIVFMSLHNFTADMKFRWTWKKE